MTHLEKFEGFLLKESVEEVKKHIEVEVNSNLEKMTKDEKNKLYSDLNKFSQKLGLSMEEMKDTKLVAKKLQELGPNSNNENILTRGLDYIKKKFNTLMMKIGASGFLSSTLGLLFSAILETVPANHIGPYMSDNQMILLHANMISFLVMSIGAMGYVAGRGRGED
jgi:hypothetical protein